MKKRNLSEDMKWNGWGNPEVEFDHSTRPKVWTWLANTLKLQPGARTERTVFDPSLFAESKISAEVQTGLEAIVGKDYVHVDVFNRYLRSVGKSFVDLSRARAGNIMAICDAVVLPDNHDQVVSILAFCSKNKVCVIPFGGGTNIVGSLDVETGKTRPVLSLDLRRMNRMLSLTEGANTALFQAGIKGPLVETSLKGRGFSLGHFPDSFEYSTLGGWIATRSAGMQSDAYGRIEDMVVSLKVATPTGTFWTKDFPASSMGPNIQSVFIGSEGQLGVITEALMKVHPTAITAEYRAYLFRTFAEGSAALKKCRMAGMKASMMRLQDEDETNLAFHLKEQKGKLSTLVEAPFKKYILLKGYTKPALLVIGFEGTKIQAASSRKEIETALKEFSALPLGTSIGNTWAKNKFDMPYIRDFIMDHGCVADVAETSAPWDKVDSLYNNVRKAMYDQYAKDGISGYLGCHVSHTYINGACLYFTFAYPSPVRGDLSWYYKYKRLITDVIVASGGTASHHHAVGVEHRPWLEKETSPIGLEMLAKIKQTLDPENLMNPGKFFAGKSVEAPEAPAPVSVSVSARTEPFQAEL